MSTGFFYAQNRYANNPIIQYLCKAVQILKEGVTNIGSLMLRIIYYTNEEKNKGYNKFPLHVCYIGYSSPITWQLVSRIIEWKSA